VRGTQIKIDHGDGLETFYYHVQYEGHIQEGDWVKQGQLLGTTANIGKSIGAHLHYGLKIDGRAVDPRVADLRPRRQWVRSVTREKRLESILKYGG